MRVKIVLKPVSPSEGCKELIRDVVEWKFDDDAFEFSFTGDFTFNDKILAIPYDNVLYVEDITTKGEEAENENN